MRRRAFIALGAASILAGTGFAPAAWAQQPNGRKRVGLLFFGGNPDGSMTATNRARVDAARAGLKEQGFIDGTNVTLDVRLGYDGAALARAARDMVGGGYDVLIGSGTPGTAALFAETKTVPIVFASASDPVGDGFVQSFARPGGNVTGFTNVEASMGGKWLEMLHQVAPAVRRAVIMVNPDIAPSRGNFFLPSFKAAAGALGIEPVPTEVRTLVEIDAVIADMGKAPGSGLVVNSDNYTLNNRRAVVDAVAREKLPAIYPYQEFVEDGGLISYGTDITDTFRHAGRYVGDILKGARPSDLPVQAPTKVLLSVNLKTAKTLGITIPPVFVALADEVIE